MILIDQGFSWSWPLPRRTQRRSGYFDSDFETIAIAKVLRYLYLRSAGVRSRTISSISLSSGTSARSVKTKVSYSFFAMLSSLILKPVIFPVLEHFLLDLFGIDIVERNFYREIRFGPMKREGAVKQNLGAAAPFSILRIGKGIERGSNRLFIFPDAPDGMAFCC